MLSWLNGWRTVIEHPGRFGRRPPRVDLRRPAVVVDSEGDEHKVTILDLSSGGFRIQLDGARIGEFVTLRGERGATFRAQVKWTLGDEAGGVFLGSVDAKLA
jgi:hypothetical protein